MSFEAVLGNKEFELVVFGVTFAVVTRRSASGHGAQTLVSFKKYMPPPLPYFKVNIRRSTQVIILHYFSTYIGLT
jgi:hypothetical protein